MSTDSMIIWIELHESLQEQTLISGCPGYDTLSKLPLAVVKLVVWHDSNLLCAIFVLDSLSLVLAKVGATSLVPELFENS